MSDSVGEVYLDSIRQRFRNYKELGERAMAQVSDDDLYWVSIPESNSIRLNIKHLSGNMRSRWTDVFTTDGEKPDRHRDAEFEEQGYDTREELMAHWEAGWSCILGALDSFEANDLLRPVKIRGQELTLMDAINRQAMHVPYHVGQIVHICRERVGADWQSLSIARGESGQYKSKPTD